MSGLNSWSPMRKMSAEGSRLHWKGIYRPEAHLEWWLVDCKMWCAVRCSSWLVFVACIKLVVSLFKREFSCVTCSQLPTKWNLKWNVNFQAMFKCVLDWIQGRNHCWEVEGGQGFGPNTGALACWVREGVALSRCEGPGVSLPPPVKFLENSDAKSCIIVTTCCEISCFLKTMAKKLGDQYIVGPPA